jgi:hypothetical protein
MFLKRESSKGEAIPSPYLVILFGGKLMSLGRFKGIDSTEEISAFKEIIA